MLVSPVTIKTTYRGNYMLVIVCSQVTGSGGTKQEYRNINGQISTWPTSSTVQSKTEKKI